MILLRKSVLIGVASFLFLLVAAIYLYNYNRTNSLQSITNQANLNFSDAYDDLNDILLANGFTVEKRQAAKCSYATPNSGLPEGTLVCEASQNAYINATNSQISSWPSTAKQISSYLTDNQWRSPKGSRGDITYVSIEKLFQKAVSGPTITIYEKNYSHGIVCKLAFTTNKEYSYNSPQKMYVSEQCTKGL